MAGAFAAYGGHGTTASSTIVYEIEPGGRLGWHTDATEETQYILAGTGELRMEDAASTRSGRAAFSSARHHCFYWIFSNTQAATPVTA